MGNRSYPGTVLGDVGWRRARGLFRINMWGGEGGVLGDVVGAAAWGSKISTLRGVE